MASKERYAVVLADDIIVLSCWRILVEEFSVQMGKKDPGSGNQLYISSFVR